MQSTAQNDPLPCLLNSNSYTAYTKAACLLNCRNEYTIKTCVCTLVEYKGMNHLTLTEL